MQLYAFITELSRWAIPAVLLVVPLVAFLRGVNVFETFVEGAESGFETAIRIIPFLVAMLMAINVFRASGAMEIMARALAPVFLNFGFPPEVLPHAILRPLSGGAALGVAVNIIQSEGPDSFIGRLVSTMQGSSDTTFYILTLYFGSIGIKKYRYSIISGLIADFTTLAGSVYIVNKCF